jgi:hypothetical protein
MGFWGFSESPLKRLKVFRSMPILSVNSDKGLLREPSEFYHHQASDKGLQRGPSGAFLLRNFSQYQSYNYSIIKYNKS